MTIRFNCVLLCILLSGCVSLVKISYPPEAVIHPTFDQPYTIWRRERVQVEWTPSLHAESFKYLARYDQVLLADSIRQRGLDHEYKTAGKGTPIVVFTKNPENTPEDKHYPASGIALGVTAVKEERQGRVPVLKLYDSFDPVVVRSATGPDPIAANYTATLAVLYSHARKVAGSAAASFLRPDNPRIATGIYLIHPYDPNKVPILFIHGLTPRNPSPSDRILKSVSCPLALGHPAYSAAKAGLISYVKSLATELGRVGIRANIILPGTVKTPAWQERVNKNPAVFEQLIKWYPLGRVVEPDDIAEAAIFLASDVAEAITGAVLPVDCGLLAGNLMMASDQSWKHFFRCKKCFQEWLYFGCNGT